MVIRWLGEKLGRVQRPIVRVVQRVLLQGSLFLLYFIGFGLSRVVMTVLARRILHHQRPRRSACGGTGWRRAEGYDLDEFRLRRQS